MISTQSLVSAIIYQKHGWAVAEQFEATFDGESFEKQNYNALMYIREAVRDVLNNNVFVLNENVHDVLQVYCDDLEQYMVEMD